MSQSMVAKHSVWPRKKDIIFNLSERAQRAEKAIGRDICNKCYYRCSYG